MPSRDELEQDLLIVEAERDAAMKEAHELRAALAAAKGENALVRTRAADAGVEIGEEEIDERRALEVLREGVDQDIEAIAELHSPTGALLKHVPPESVTEIVRANQRERAELQERTATATTLLSRIAAIVKLDRWDEQGGDKLLERLQRMAHVRLKMEKRLKELKPQLAVDTLDTPYKRGEVASLEWALALGLEKLPVDPTQPRRLTFVVIGNEVVYHCKPDDTVAEIRDTVLGIVYQGANNGARKMLPFDQWLIFDENGAPLPIYKRVSELVLPTERIVITTPVGVGA